MAEKDAFRSFRSTSFILLFWYSSSFSPIHNIGIISSANKFLIFALMSLLSSFKCILLSECPTKQ